MEAPYFPHSTSANFAVCDGALSQQRPFTNGINHFDKRSCNNGLKRIRAIVAHRLISKSLLPHTWSSEWMQQQRFAVLAASLPPLEIHKSQLSNSIPTSNLFGLRCWVFHCCRSKIFNNFGEFKCILTDEESDGAGLWSALETQPHTRPHCRYEN